MTAREQKRFDIEFPKRQRFTKTDLAKVEMAWLGFPHVVSAGAQKNFAKYAERIGKEWEASDTAFIEEFFRDAISRAIIFRST